MEMKEYDRAANNFYSKQQFKSLPLVTWDMFSIGYSNFCLGLNELDSLKEFAKKQRWETVSCMESEILEKNQVVVVTDTDLNIVHASKNIYEMNGYHPKEIIGRKPKMFQGEKTCKITTQKIKAAIDNCKPFKVVVLNYRKDGSTYKCSIKGLPIKNEKGKVVNFIAFENEVA